MPTMEPIDLPHPVLDPSQAQPLSTKALRVPAEMVLQIASGLDTPEDIAARYGYSAEEFTALRSWTPFVQEVAKVRAELEKSGFDFVLDSRLKAKELSNVIFLRAMKDDATFGQVHDAFRTFTEFADLKPKTVNPNLPGQAPGGAPGFSINIVLGPATPVHDPKGITIDVIPDTEPPPRFAPKNPFIAVQE